MRHSFVGLAALLGSFLGFSRAAHAQGNYVDDALLYSRQNPTGTARTLGLGGASTSLGGDYGSMSTNPAGLGVYTKSEFTFSPGIGLGNATASPQANRASTTQASTDQSANSFHIASLGLVFTNRRADSDNSSEWRGGSFGLGFTRLADFNYGFRYRNTVSDANSFYQFLREPGGNASNSFTGSSYQGAVSDIRNQESTGDFYNLDGLAYSNYLTNISQVKSGNTTYDVVTIRNARTGAVQQDGLVQSKGSLSQFDLGYGGNFRDRLYIGGAVGIVSMNRTLTTSFGESQNGSENFNYSDYVRTTGTGLNARLGVIVRPVDILRIGASVQTPTYIGLTSDYSTTLTANPSYVPTQYSNVLTTSPDGRDYSVTLPFRANGGLTLLFGKYGFLTGDIEYVNTASTRFNPNANSSSTLFSDTNDLIKGGYKNTVNLKGGLEGRFSIFRARVGYARYGDPYRNGTLDRAQNYFTGGLGIRNKTFFLDVAEVYLANIDSQYAPYRLVSADFPVINSSASRATTTVTAGFIF